jgi:hypothetical protein
MSSEASGQAKQALETNKALANRYYGVALPALGTRNQAINQSLALGEPGFLTQAYGMQRTGLSEGLAAQGGVAQAGQMAGAKKALSGGNFASMLAPSDIGAQLANALYGSKFQQGQANVNQMLNLTSMGLGGAGSAGNAALGASGNELKAIGYMPHYNQTYANVVGGLAGGASIYGAYKNWLAAQPQPFGTPVWTDPGFGQIATSGSIVGTPP